MLHASDFLWQLSGVAFCEYRLACITHRRRHFSTSQQASLHRHVGDNSRTALLGDIFRPVEHPDLRQHAGNPLFRPDSRHRLGGGLVGPAGLCKKGDDCLRGAQGGVHFRTASRRGGDAVFHACRHAVRGA